MFSFKDITVLTKFSRILVVPLFVVANILDGKQRFSQFNWLLDKWGFLGMFLWLILIFVIVAFLYSLIDAMYCHLVSKISSFQIMYWSGLLFITLGIIYLTGVFTDNSITPFNVFWHLGFFCQGIRFLELSS